MTRETEFLRGQLFLILSRLKKKAAFWTAPMTIRMNEKAGALLYDILGKENGDWALDKERHRLKGCSCTMSEGRAGGSVTYRRFYLCREHAKDLFQMPSPAKIDSERPAVKMHTSKGSITKDHKGHRDGAARNDDPSESIFGWHDGAYLTSGGIPGLGKRK
jgi:hypothetical protein